MKEEAKKAAKDMIRHYVLRGDSYQSLRAGQLGSYSDSYHASIGGYLNGKKINTDKILVEKVRNIKCEFIFSLKNLIEEILTEQIQPSLF